MDFSIAQIITSDFWMNFFLITDKILFAFYLLSVGYLFFFAIASTLSKKQTYPESSSHRHFALFFFVQHGGIRFLDTLNTFLDQEYPRDRYDLIVVFNPVAQPIYDDISQYPVKRILTDSNHYTKAEAIRFAVNHFSKDNYDVAIIMNDISIVPPRFIAEINNALALHPHSALQVHRSAYHLDTDIALFGAISEEINNSIFRRGHVNVGLSSGLTGSGMVINYKWLKNNIDSIQGLDLEKGLEMLLLEQYVFIDYLEQIDFKEMKVARVEEFSVQRRSWISNQAKSLKLMLAKFPIAVVQGNYDYCNKVFQWLLPSRIILVGTLVMIVVMFIFIAWGMAIKWIALLLLLIISFSIALPDHFIDGRFVRAIRGAPVLFLVTVVEMLIKKRKKF